MNPTDLISFILAAFSIVATIGGAVAWFLKSRGEGLLKLSERNVTSLQEENAIQARKIIGLQSQLDVKDQTIERLLRK